MDALVGYSTGCDRQQIARDVKHGMSRLLAQVYRWIHTRLLELSQGFAFADLGDVAGVVAVRGKVGFVGDRGSRGERGFVLAEAVRLLRWRGYGK